jgi:hypothetical protein
VPQHLLDSFDVRTALSNPARERLPAGARVRCRRFGGGGAGGGLDVDCVCRQRRRVSTVELV